MLFSVTDLPPSLTEFIHLGNLSDVNFTTVLHFW